MTDQNELLFAEAALGRDAKEFLQSEIGRYIIGRCDIEIAEAREKLDCVSFRRSNRIKSLQNQIWRAKQLKMWIAELIIQGNQAEIQLEEINEYQKEENQ